LAVLGGVEYGAKGFESAVPGFLFAVALKVLELLDRFLIFLMDRKAVGVVLLGLVIVLVSYVDHLPDLSLGGKTKCEPADQTCQTRWPYRTSY